MLRAGMLSAILAFAATIEMSADDTKRLTCEGNMIEPTAMSHPSDQLPVSLLSRPIRSLHTKYPAEDLARSLAEGIRTGHPTMPQFQLNSAQIVDVISYLKTLEN